MYNESEQPSVYVKLFLDEDEVLYEGPARLVQDESTRVDFVKFSAPPTIADRITILSGAGMLIVIDGHEREVSHLEDSRADASEELYELRLAVMKP